MPNSVLYMKFKWHLNKIFFLKKLKNSLKYKAITLGLSTWVVKQKGL